MYPTQQQILAKPVVFKPETMDTVKRWRNEFYDLGKWRLVDKNDAIRELLKRLAESYEKPVEICIEDKMNPCYQHATQTIYLGSMSPSILTALHEFAHHLYGTSEAKACRWSVWLFIKQFPKAYGKLVWSKHRLVKA